MKDIHVALCKDIPVRLDSQSCRRFGDDKAGLVLTHTGLRVISDQFDDALCSLLGWQRARCRAVRRGSFGCHVDQSQKRCEVAT